MLYYSDFILYYLPMEKNMATHKILQLTASMAALQMHV